ncbi:MAG: hydroxymethylbilane synthase, partial [Desulfatiglandales bacterium]
MRKIRIGTRKSKLAIAQSEWVASWLRERYPEFAVELVRITTSGDRIQDFPLSKVGGKGLFVKEIEEALLREEVDLAVHSLKDMPAELPKGLSIICYPEREDPRDALITNTPSDLETLSPFSRIGTSSLRRKCQLISMRKDLEIIPLRGNVDTRLKKLKTEGLDGIILAMAGINRLGIEVPHLEPIPLSLLIPAVGQGCLA